MTATYRALVPIALPGHAGVAAPGDLLIEGSNIPVGWVPPSGDVDPLTPDAVLNYYATMPRLPPANRGVSKVVTAWQVTHLPSYDQWTLNGLGSNLPAINM